jgi:hypothetical protein
VTERLLGPRIKVLALYEPTLATLPWVRKLPRPARAIGRSGAGSAVPILDRDVLSAWGPTARVAVAG